MELAAGLNDWLQRESEATERTKTGGTCAGDAACGERGERGERAPADEGVLGAPDHTRLID